MGTNKTGPTLLSRPPSLSLSLSVCTDRENMLALRLARSAMAPGMRFLSTDTAKVTIGARNLPPNTFGDGDMEDGVNHIAESWAKSGGKTGANMGLGAKFNWQKEDPVKALYLREIRRFQDRVKAVAAAKGKTVST